MTRERLTTLITAGVLTLGLGFLVAKNKGVTLADVNPTAIAQSLTPKTAAPEDSIYAMLDAAKAGDAKAYLACYTGHMKDLLAQSALEATSAGFEKYLRTSNAAIQGVALSPPRNGDRFASQGAHRVRLQRQERDSIPLFAERRRGLEDLPGG